MKNRHLTQYLFGDGHEEIANPKGRLVAVRDPERGAQDYLPMRGGLRARYVKGSLRGEGLYLCKGKFSDEPQVGEQLVTGSWFLGWFEYISNARIKQINKSFRFPQDSE